MEDITFLKEFSFEKSCKYLGNTTLNVTIINGGLQHNVIPDSCTYTIDIRMNAEYTGEDIIALLQPHLHAIIKPRSLRLRPSIIEENHIFIKAGKALHIPLYPSLTMSDQALMPFPTIKFGPGNSHRSHTADEFIFLSEIYEGTELYIQFLTKLRDIS